MLNESLSMFKRRLKGISAIKRYSGSPEQICKQIINGCYNGTYFQTSAGHFSNFYIRDFGMCVEALLKLGYKKEVYNTLSYALSCYAKHGTVTTTIKSNGACKDFFNIGPDSLAFLLFSLRVSKADALVSGYKEFLEKEIVRYYVTIVNKNTGLARKGYFSSIKDHAIRNSSCYDNCMLAMIAREATLLKLSNEFNKHNYKKLILDRFWNKEKGYVKNHRSETCSMLRIVQQQQGVFDAQNSAKPAVFEHTEFHLTTNPRFAEFCCFKDDLDNDIPTGDANVFPYWCRIFDEKQKQKKSADEKEMLIKSINAIQKNSLDKPFPLKYWNSKKYGHFLFFPSLFAKHYETNTVWIHLGLCYLDVIARYDRKLLKTYLSEYTKLIKEYNNFMEVYTEDGKPYNSLFYLSDESMIWCAKYLYLLQMV